MLLASRDYNRRVGRVRVRVPLRRLVSKHAVKCEGAEMAGRRVVQDSDDESNGEGSPQAADQEPLDLSLDTIIDLQSSSPPKILQQSGQLSTGSTGKRKANP